MGFSDRESQFDKALLSLRSLILAGEFAANTRLPEIALAERLDISRTPLRQAMARLVEERLLDRIKTGGCRVASFTMADILDAIEIRGVIEATAARLAAERGGDPDLLAAADATLAHLDRAVLRDGDIDFEGYVLHNAEFHRLIAALAGSRMVEREVERVNSLPLASPSAFLLGHEFIPDFQDSLRRAQHQHRAILSAIKAREGARAEALMREHARLARENLEHVMGGDPGLVKQVPGLALVRIN
jgi:GntR family transcriptional regulator of vanillate catabolism